jgi:hypothetical protein
MSESRGETFCIEAPGSKHRPDPDTWASTAFCAYCSEEIEQRDDGKWQTVPCGVPPTEGHPKRQAYAHVPGQLPDCHGHRCGAIGCVSCNRPTSGGPTEGQT